MSQEKSAAEPSMEEILSSIRRIIADEQKAGGPSDDGSVPSAHAPPPLARPPATFEDDVLELTEVVEEEPEAPAPSPPPVAPQEIAAVSEKDPGLVSPSAASASTNAFAKLTRTIAPEERPAGSLGGQSVEDLLLELLRPALKEWLDANLPAVVERVVEQEVKKLARRAELS